MNTFKGAYVFKWLFCIAMLLWMVTAAFAQVNAYEGKRFWLTYLKPNAFSPQPVTVSLLSRTGTTATLRNPAKGFTVTVNLVANTPQDVVVPATAISADTPESIDSLGVEIVSGANITVQFAGISSFADGTMIYPYDHLGIEYYAMSYEGTPSGNPSGKSSLVVVASENNTIVEITPSVQTGGGKPAGSPYYIVLNQGYTYRLEGFNSGDLTGTRIRVTNGCKPIGVLSGSSCSQVPASCTICGHLIEMMPHVDTWGKSFLVAPLEGSSFQSPEHTYRILATTNSTVVDINGTTSTMNKGEVKTINDVTSTTSVCITASYPVLVAQYTQGYGCQGGALPRMMTVTPTEQLVKNAVVMGNIPNLFGNFYQTLIITRTTARNRLRYDGSSVPVSSFSTFSSCSDWSYVSITDSRGPVSITSDSGFLAYSYCANFTAAYMNASAANSRILKYDIGVAPPQCGSLTVNLFNSGDSSRISSSNWIFDDNTTQTGKQVSKTYPAHGLYAVTNVVAYQDACPYIDTIKTTYRTIPRPIVGFNINDSTQCLSVNDFTFNDNSQFTNGTKKRRTYWNFSDTVYTYPNSLSVNRKFYNYGTVKVQLVAENTDLCADSFSWNVKVYADALPEYSVTSPQCFNSHAFNPLQLSAAPGSTITGYEWDFGDGTQSTQASPVKKYTKDSTYQITLIARAATGCDDTIQRSFTVYPSPKADFSTGNACLNDTLKATNLSVFSEPLTYLWKLGDGSQDTSTNIIRKYADTGTYKIVLTARTDKGCPDSSTKTAVVMPAPLPDFIFDKKCTKSPSVFTNKTNTFNVPAPQYSWEIGESTAYTTPHVIHTYQNEGLYTVKLFAALTNGCKDSTQRTLYINPIPKVGFTINDSLQCIRGNKFDFFNGTTLSEGKIKEFTWKQNDSFVSNSVSFSKIYTTHGNYTMKLVAQTDSLCADSIVKPFEVAPQTQMNVNLAVDTQCFKNHAFDITNTSTIPAGTVKYYWKYSNGDIDSIVQPPPKIFTSAGKFQLVLLAVSNKGCRDSVIENLTIHPSPDIDFEVNDVCGSDSARFLNFSKVSTGRIVEWKWDLGDGDSSADKRPVHKYNNFGYYDVRLIGITDLGCADTLFDDSALKVKPAPTSFFNTQLLSQRGGQTVYDFNDLSVAADNFYWNFDRGQTSREKNPQFIFTDTGAYHIVLTVSNNDGCFSSYDTTIFVVPDIEVIIPNAFSPNNDIINPVFRIEGSYFYREFEMQIFDRWGQRVFFSTNPDQGWDGNFDGRPVPEGIYIYSIRMLGTDNKVRNYKGNLHVLH